MPPWCAPGAVCPSPRRLRRGDLRLAAGRHGARVPLEARGDPSAAPPDAGAEGVDVLLARLVDLLEQLFHLPDPHLAGGGKLRPVLLQARCDLSVPGFASGQNFARSALQLGAWASALAFNASPRQSATPTVSRRSTGCRDLV